MCLFIAGLEVQELRPSSRGGDTGVRPEVARARLPVLVRLRGLVSSRKAVGIQRSYVMTLCRTIERGVTLRESCSRCACKVHSVAFTWLQLSGLTSLVSIRVTKYGSYRDGV